MRRKIFAPLLGALLSVMLAVSAAFTGENQIEKLFEEQKFAEAKDLAVKLLEQDKDNTDLLYNGGLAAYLSGDYQTAGKLWRRLKELDGEDLQLRGKLVQAYEASGETELRDAEIAELHKVYEAGKDTLYKENSFFIRDQFTTNGIRIMVFEYFDLSIDRAIKWKFMVLSGEGKTDYVISLGSYASTNAVIKESSNSGDGVRFFHLDGYFNGGRTHYTYSFYEGLPKYEEIKETVKGIIAGTVQPISSSQIKTQEQ